MRTKVKVGDSLLVSRPVVMINSAKIKKSQKVKIRSLYINGQRTSKANIASFQKVEAIDSFGRAFTISNKFRKPNFWTRVKVL